MEDLTLGLTFRLIAKTTYNPRFIAQKPIVSFVVNTTLSYPQFAVWTYNSIISLRLIADCRASTPEIFRVSTAQSRGVISTLLNPFTLLSVSVKNREPYCFIVRSTLYLCLREKDYLSATGLNMVEQRRSRLDHFFFPVFSQKHIYIIQIFLSLVKKFFTFLLKNLKRTW